MIAAPVHPLPRQRYSVRQMRAQDVSNMNTLFVQSMDTDYHYFPNTYKQELIKDHSKLKLLRSILSPKSCVLIANSQQVMVGYCIIRLERLEPATLLWIYVDARARGMGIGRELVSETFRRAKHHRSPAIQLLTHNREEYFAQQGFSTLRRIPGMLAGVDMIIMRAELS